MVLRFTFQLLFTFEQKVSEHALFGKLPGINYIGFGKFYEKPGIDTWFQLR